jgi:hypothetical protein
MGLQMLTLSKTSDSIAYPPKVRYAFEEMSVGESIYICDFKKAESARVSAIQFSKRKQLGWRFSIRKMDGGWRLFRVS